MAVDFTKVPPPAAPRISIKERMTPQEVAEAFKQLDLWTRTMRSYVDSLRDAVIELQDT